MTWPVSAGASHDEKASFKTETLRFQATKKPIQSGPTITIQNITGERFLHGNERSGLREGSSAASFFPQGWNFFPAETDLFSRKTGPFPPQGRNHPTCRLRALPAEADD